MPFDFDRKATGSGPYRARTDDIHGVNVIWPGPDQTGSDWTTAITGISVRLVLADSGTI